MADVLSAAIPILIVLPIYWLHSAVFGTGFGNGPAVPMDTLGTTEEPIVLTFEHQGARPTWHSRGRNVWYVLTIRRILRVRSAGDVFSLHHWYAPRVETLVSLVDVERVHVVSELSGILTLKTPRGYVDLKLDSASVCTRWAAEIERLIDELSQRPPSEGTPRPS